MRMPRAASLVLLPWTSVGWIALISCGGAGDGETPQTGVYPNDSSTTGTSNDSSTTGMSNDGSTTETPDGGDDSNDAGGPDATEVDADAANEPDVTDIAPSDNEVCHVVWPQPPGLVLQTNPQSSPLQLATDLAGNAYIALSFESIATTSGDDSGVQDGGALDVSATLDLGVTSPGYPQGVAVAKVDAQCNLLWMREFGVTDVATSTASSLGIGVDANSNVTVLGIVFGSANLGAETADAAPIFTDAGTNISSMETFLLRIDPGGNLLFSKIFRSTEGSIFFGHALAVTPNGVSTIVALGPSGADFGNGPVGPVDAGDTEYLVQFDTTGTVSLVKEAPSYQQLLADPNGGLWASTQTALMPSMMRLSATGDVLWSRPLTSSQLLAVNKTGQVAAGVTSSGNLSEDIVTAYSPDGTMTSSQVTWVDYVGELAEQVILDPMGDTIVGGDFWGTHTSRDSPAGAGFQRFDSSGALRSFTTWGGADTRFGAVGVAPNGNVLLLGWIEPRTASTISSVFFVRFVP